LRQDGESRGNAETKPIFALPSADTQPASEALVGTDGRSSTQVDAQPQPPQARVQPPAEQRTTDYRQRTADEPTGFETRPLFALPNLAEPPSLDSDNASTAPSNALTNRSVDLPVSAAASAETKPMFALGAPASMLAELLIEPAGAAAPSPSTPTGTKRNKTPNRGSAIQRAVERLKGRSNTESAGAERRALLGGSMELREYWKIIQKRLWLIVLLMLVGGSVSGYYAYQQPPRYRSTTTLYLNPAAANAVMSYQYDTLASLAQTYSEFMKTRSFGSQVAEKITLDTGTIIGALSTNYVANTQFYQITATYSDPEMTQSLANTAAKVLIDQNIARQQAQQEQIQAQSAPDPERDRLIEVRSSLQDELDIYNSQITTVRARLADLESQPKSEEVDKQILDYRNQLVDFQASRLSAINGLANTQAALTTTAPAAAPNLDTAVVVDVAPLPSGPLPDTTIQYILVALLAALSVGAALAFLLEYMDYTIKTPEAMEAIYGNVTQGAIGLAGGKRVAERSAAQLVTLNDPHSPLAESFRALRTGVSVAGLIAQMRSLMVTSARPGEGKTFIASNLAVSLAQNGNRVILVDADLRKPSLHYVFDLQLDPGFTNLVLDSTGKIEDFLQPTKVDNLRVLTCGIIPPNPAELLGSPRAAAVMEQLLEYADVVMYDSPPAATVVDAVVMGPRVDAVLHVIHAGKTRIDLVRRCKALLERGGAHILGPVLNQVSLPELRSYSYYYSYSYKQAGGKKARRGKAPSNAKVRANGAAARTK
jgi:non-specific protein-tyrosine kinase